MRAWWSGDLTTLLAEAPEAIVQRLAVRLVETHHLNHAAQLAAWREQVTLLQAVARGLPGDWRVLLEYPLLRLGKRIDAVLLTDRAILVLEFKAADQTRLAREQVEDYALDLFDFHVESRAHPVVPILVVTQGQPRAVDWPLCWHAVTPVLDATARSLPALVHEIVARIPAAERPVDVPGWEAAPYRPVPTIVEAATMLYRRHGVAEIAAARADVGNLTRTGDAIADAMAHWFLDRWPDVRASDSLELPATQFACQGLELDHVGLCWGNDLIRQGDHRQGHRAGRVSWLARGFAGTRWQAARGEATIAYQVNTYRVLLTRARYETVIWVPRGDPDDATRDPADFNTIARFLADCGARELEEIEMPSTPMPPVCTPPIGTPIVGALL